MHYIEVYFSPQYEFAVSPDSSNVLSLYYLPTIIFANLRFEVWISGKIFYHRVYTLQWLHIRSWCYYHNIKFKKQNCIWFSSERGTHNFRFYYVVRRTSFDILCSLRLMVGNLAWNHIQAVIKNGVRSPKTTEF